MRAVVVGVLIPVLVLSNTLAADDALSGPAPIRRVERPLEWKNVALNKGGLLAGQVVNKTGQPIAEAELLVEQQGATQVVKSATDGRFAVSGLKSGPCVIRMGDETFACRVWEQKIAPPGSLRSLAVVSQTDIVRGNLLPPLPLIQPGHGILGGNHFGLVLLGLGGAAIAIGASQDDSDNAS